MEKEKRIIDMDKLLAFLDKLINETDEGTMLDETFVISVATKRIVHLLKEDIKKGEFDV